MKKLILAATIAAVFLGFAAPGNSADEELTYYARCNIRVFDGAIWWENWLASDTFIPAGTRLGVSLYKDYGFGDSSEPVSAAFIIDKRTGKKYSLKSGAQKSNFIEKNLSKEPVEAGPAFADTIKKEEVAVGMSKEQVYAAMCLPPYVLGSYSGTKGYIGVTKTDKSGFGDIMAANYWVYLRKKLGKRLIIEFDEASGSVKDVYWKVL